MPNIQAQNREEPVAVVTGASRGIGRRIAEALAEDGVRLLLASRSSKELKAMAHGLPRTTYMTTDLRKPLHVSKLVEAALKEYGRVDVFINAAEQCPRGPVETIDIEVYREIIELNTIAVLRSMQAVIPHMRVQGRGLIIVIDYPDERQAAFASTKAATESLVRLADGELKDDGIIVKAVECYARETAEQVAEKTVEVVRRFNLGF